MRITHLIDFWCESRKNWPSNRFLRESCQYISPRRSLTIQDNSLCTIFKKKFDVQESPVFLVKLGYQLGGTQSHYCKLFFQIFCQILGVMRYMIWIWSLKVYVMKYCKFVWIFFSNSHAENTNLNVNVKIHTYMESRKLKYKFTR